MEDIKIKSIEQLHELLDYVKPCHPLITIIDLTKIEALLEYNHRSISGEFYTITLKDGRNCELRYGRKHYDFSEGSMSFTAPGQSIAVEVAEDLTEGWMLLFHSDLIRNSIVSQRMPEYTFFSYKINEALHLSDREKHIITSVVMNIQEEYEQTDDSYSHELIITYIEMLLGYAKRFYGRQFITRKMVCKDVMSLLDSFLEQYYKAGKYESEGIPSVKLIAKELGYSSNYFGDLMKKETGANAKDHIHRFTIEKAKDMLLGTNAPISEISFRLGFEYAANFSKFFKKKVGVSPTEYRK